MKYLIPFTCLAILRSVSAFHLFKVSPQRLSVKKTKVVHHATTTRTSPDEHNQDNPVWLTPNEMKALSQETKIPVEKLSAVHSDVTFYQKSLEPTMYRINHNSKEILKTTLDTQTLSSSPNPLIVQDAAEKTVRWCSDFVQTLNLCPWAKLSLQSHNAIRIKIMNQSIGTDAMEQLIRDSALELISLTDSGDVDINVGITFVIAIGNNDDNDDDDANGGVQAFDFEDFYNFAIDLEDRMFDEADAAHEQMEMNEDDFMPMDPLFGDKVTIAPFHPSWHFAIEGEAGENPLNFEKKSPFPTVSLVRTSVIVEAGEEATLRIGQHNEEKLTEYGSKRLGAMYKEKVLRELD